MQPSARISSSLSRCPCSSTKLYAPPALRFLRWNAGCGVGVRLFAADGTFCAVCGIFCCRLSGAVHLRCCPQSGALHPAGCCGGHGFGAAHGKPDGAHPCAIRRPSAAADGRGGKRIGILLSRHRGCSFACGSSKRCKSVLPGGVRCAAAVRSRGPGAGPVCAVCSGAGRPGRPVCRRHCLAGGSVRGNARLCRSGAERQFPRPHPAACWLL